MGDVGRRGGIRLGRVLALVALVASTIGLAAGPVAAEAPDGLRSTAQTGLTFVLTWDPVPGAEEYVVYLDGEENGRSEDNWHVQRSVGQRFLEPLTIYSVQVAAVIGGLEGDRSAPIDVTTSDISLPQPTVLVGVSSPTVVTVKAAQRPYAAMELERDGVVVGRAGAQVIDRDLAGAETYTYRLRYVSQVTGALGPWSEPITVTMPGEPAGTVLAPPVAAVTFVDNSTVVVKIDGDDSMGRTGIFAYEIERNGDLVDTLRTAYSDRNLWFVDTPLPSGTDQTYRVRAVSWDGTRGEWSSDLAATTTGMTPPDIDDMAEVGVEIEDLSLHVVADGSVTLSWSRLDGAHTYQIVRNGETIRILPADRSFATDFRAGSGDVYAIVALADDGSPLSDPVTVEAPAFPPRTGPIVVTRAERRVVVLRWDIVTGEDSYRILRDGVPLGEVDLGWFVDSAFVGSTQAAEAAPLEAGTTYRYRVETTSGDLIGTVDVTTVPAR